MTTIIIIGISIIAMIAIGLMATWLYLKNKSKALTQELYTNTTYKNDGTIFTSIEADMENSFEGQIITFAQSDSFASHYNELLNKAETLSGKLGTFHIKIPETIEQFITDYYNIPTFTAGHNERIIQRILDVHKDFFDHCLKYPLDQQQRRSIVSEEDNCLVVSSAGSGKTSSIIGK